MESKEINMSKKRLPTDKVLSLLGLAKKAGRLVSGEFMTENALLEGKAYLVIVAKDASDNTKKHFYDMCNFRNVPYILYGSKENIGQILGYEIRASLAITDEGFAQSIMKKVDEI